MNTDGDLGIADILLIYDFVLGALNPFGLQYSIADYDSNGIIDALDASILISVVLNIN